MLVKGALDLTTKLNVGLGNPRWEKKLRQASTRYNIGYVR